MIRQLSFWVYGKKALDVSTRYDELLEKVLKEHEQKRSSRDSEEHHSHAENERDLMDILLDVHHDPHAEFKITRTHVKAFFLKPSEFDGFQEEIELAVLLKVGTLGREAYQP
ncbi:hypothetical protein VIGAN_04381600 [Vigna angularis var. angularis]|uniref:Uncharacterized protein n=1 Tax=Vigna angularis var. angularis TaxID=157739 RepID=A0A0S3S036_PHAAN|nr:hypothetical protein VIGAN_04381600 [Vigna angularis var. angularis]